MIEINKLRDRVNKELHRNSDDFYWQAISELLEIIEIQQDAINIIKAVIEDTEDVK